MIKKVTYYNSYCDFCGALIKNDVTPVEETDRHSFTLCDKCFRSLREVTLKYQADELAYKKREEASPEFGQNNTPINYCGSSPKRYFDAKISQEYEEEMNRIGQEGLEKD